MPLAASSLNVSMPERMRAYVDARVSTGGYGNHSEFIRDLIRSDQQREAKRALEQLALDQRFSVASSAPTKASTETGSSALSERLAVPKPKINQRAPKGSKRLGVGPVAGLSREAEAKVIARLAALATGTVKRFASSREANLARLAAMMLATDFPVESARLGDLATRYFATHPSAKQTVSELLALGWIQSLPRLRALLQQHLKDARRG